VCVCVPTHYLYPYENYSIEEVDGWACRGCVPSFTCAAEREREITARHRSCVQIRLWHLGIKRLQNVAFSPPLDRCVIIHTERSKLSVEKRLSLLPQYNGVVVVVVVRD
jgi:hypothetical protein